MKVSFKGFKNVGSIGYAEKTDFGRPINSQTWYHVELTNKNGKDLEENKSLLAKYPNSINPSALNVRSSAHTTINGVTHDIFINKHKVDLNNKENIEDVKKVKNIMNKIQKTPYHEMEKDPKYRESYEIIDAFDATFEDCVKKDVSGQEYLDKQLFDHYMNVAHTESLIKHNANIISGNIFYNFKDLGVE